MWISLSVVAALVATASQAAAADDTYEADQGRLSAVTELIGASEVWRLRDGDGRPVTGRGVGVALIDSGIVPVPGLADGRRVFDGPDLSFESQAEHLRWLDTFGHGTHLAGIIAGRDAPRTGATERFRGVAPGATLVSLKVATSDGATDVSQVIAAIDWVVEHKDDPGLNLRVINLAFGTLGLQPYALDPLAYAVEVAWRNGIVVVVSAGNDGSPLTMRNPAVDPYVIAVGATDSNGTPSPDDDTVADFSNRGSLVRRPDVLAPGRSIVSLRNPGSSIDRDHPEGLVSWDAERRYFRGSGTSQAAAVVSGAVALLLQHRPALTPDEVKHLLASTADPVAGSSLIGGAGALDVDGAIEAPTPTAGQATQSHAPATGLGPLELARGASHVVDPATGDALVGEVDLFGGVWDAALWTVASLTGTSWSGGRWMGRPLTGWGWTDESWTGRSWSGRSWSGRSWSGRSWSGRSWSANQWQGDGWSGDSWAGPSWLAPGWDELTWSTARWAR